MVIVRSSLLQGLGILLTCFGTVHEALATDEPDFDPQTLAQALDPASYVVRGHPVFSRVDTAGSGERYHDVGGRLSGEALDLSSAPYEPWEKDIDAIHFMLSDAKRRRIYLEEFRRALTLQLGRERYLRLDFYERWAIAVEILLVEKGLISPIDVGSLSFDANVLCNPRTKNGVGDGVKDQRLIDRDEAKRRVNLVKQALIDRGIMTQDEILSGEDEALGSGQGVLAAMPDADGLVADMGGGSLELVRVAGDAVLQRTSLRLGTMRVAEIRASGHGKLRRHVQTVLGKLAWLDDCAGRPLYLVGGAWRALAHGAVMPRKTFLTVRPTPGGWSSP